MATSQHRQPLQRLFIPPALNPGFADTAPAFSPGLPTAITQGMHPPPFMNLPAPVHPNMPPLQTPMQPGFFPPQPPPAPGRPAMHRSHPSVAQYGLMPNGMPMTPLGVTGFNFGPMTPFGPPPPQQFVPRSKRAASVSVGGPPKAILGGPQRKVSPLPPPAPPAAPVVKTKKVVVNLPKETVEDAEQPAWARTPLKDVSEQPDIVYPEVMSADPYPPDAWRNNLPPTVDVFLPGKAAWTDMKRKVIEEKLEKLGVERGSTSSQPNIHAPHARAASISSPADPALLFFKLNKLQQSQNASQSASLATSPQPSNASPSPSILPPRLQNRHGHSLSLAQPPSFSSSPVYNPAGAFNPFGPGATLGSDQILSERMSPAPFMAPLENIHAPQGRVPANFSTLAPPLPLSRPESGPDFARGFGLDTTAEEEEPPEEPPRRDDDLVSVAGTITELAQEDDQDGVTTVAQSRVHSRHVSHLSAALSLHSVGGVDGALVPEPFVRIVPARSPGNDVEAEDLDEPSDLATQDQEAVGEWTGSEDQRTGEEVSEDESIGEWSNPSDEERARHARLERRMLRRAKQQDLETPRRLPNFPIPPPTGHAFVPTLPASVRDDDIVSNPSEEGHREVQEQYLALEQDGYYARPLTGRPLPPLPNSRPTSAPYSSHDPAMAHSRETSGQFYYPAGLQSRLSQPPAPAPSLNPLAKPFVFGTASWAPAAPPQPVVAHAPSGSNSSTAHARTPSFGKPLNAAAQEFKPTFTFRPPPGVPQLAFTEGSRPLPTPPSQPPVAVGKSPARAQQGREKRLRRASEDAIESDEDEDGVNTMSSFRFPPHADAPAKAERHSAPSSPSKSVFGDLNVGTKPFSFPTYSTALPNLSQPTAVPRSPMSEDEEINDENLPPTQSPLELSPSAQDLPLPPTMKSKRAPIPLDFKHPVSTNTVPAGLFKSLANGDGEERTRRTVRSRLSSRDIFEHSARQSLDDLHVPTISHRVTRGRLFTEPGIRSSSPPPVDVFSAQRPTRRSSLPPRHNPDDSDSSDLSIPPVNLTRRIELQQFEQRLDELLDEKLEFIKRTLMDFRQSRHSSPMAHSAESMLSEVMSMVHAQLQQSASKTMANGEADARGDLDFEMLKGILEQGQVETRQQLRTDILEVLNAHNYQGYNARIAEELSTRTINAVVHSSQQLAQRLQSMESARLSPATEREATVREVINQLTPRLAQLRAEPIDYEGLTVQLTQAVKPHISQLIDLASDKRETAGLIVDRLLPLLPNLQPQAPAFDPEAVVGRLTTEVRKIVAPLDAHEIKEQVSDLVVERLDSRLAVRDKALNIDALGDKLAGHVHDLFAPIQEIRSAVDALAEKHGAVSTSAVDLSGLKEDIRAVLSDLPQRMLGAIEALGAAQTEFRKHTEETGESDDARKNFQAIEQTLNNVADEQRKMWSQNQEFSDFCQDIIKHINTLPEAMVEATSILQNVHAEFAGAQNDAEEIRRLMATSADLQVQLAKARGAHGQVRVEKDVIADRLKAAEAERERLMAKMEEMQNMLSANTAKTVTTEAKNAELEEALASALERVKAADVQSKSQAERLAQFEKANHELTLEKQHHQSQVEKLEMRVGFVAREKETLAEELAAQRQQNEENLSRQGHWDELRQAVEQIQTFASTMSNAENEELRELRRVRDRSKTLEAEHASLQRRMKEFETRMANNDKVAQASRQSLAQAQQRAVEWEKRATEYQSELNSVQSRLDDAEQARSQLEGDFSLVKLQLEERDAEERLDRDRQSKLRDQIAALEGQVARLQAETDQAKKIVAAQPQPVAPRPLNGQARIPLARPESRASTIYPDDSRAGTPTARKQNGTRAPSIRAPSPKGSVWDSIHAPKNRAAYRSPYAPKAQHTNSYYRPQIPSPTPSNVSAAPTLGEDGWYQ